jgi:hypothetical protein
MDELVGLAAVLAAEYAAVYGYGVAGAALVRTQAPPVAVGLARSGLDAHRTERDRLLVALARSGAAVPPAEPAYAVPFPLSDAAAALRLLALLEERLAAVCTGAVGAAQDRLLVVDILAAAAVRRVQVRRAAGASVAAAVVPFPGGTA